MNHIYLLIYKMCKNMNHIYLLIYKMCKNMNHIHLSTLHVHRERDADIKTELDT